jgi:hypothetical protein
MNTVYTRGIKGAHQVRRSLVSLLAGGLLILGLAGCDSTNVEPPSTTGTAPMSVSFTVADGAATGNAVAKDEMVLTDSTGATLQLSRVEMVIREVEFERAEANQRCPSGESTSAINDEACEKVEEGPILVTLPLSDGGPSVAFDAKLPEGTWRAVEFDVHKLEDDNPADSTFLARHDFPAGVSIRAIGMFGQGGVGTEFVFTTDINEEREVEFSPPIEVSGDSPKNVTFAVDLNQWFRTEDGRLVDPARAGDDGRYEDRVEENIETSIEGFEDDDRDGRRDDDFSDDGDDDGADDGNDGDDDGADDGNDGDDDGTDDGDDGDDDGTDDGDDGDDDGADDGDDGDDDGADDGDDGDDDSDDDGDNDGDDGDETGDGENDDDDSDDLDDDESETEVRLVNTGPDPDADGEAEFETEEDRTEFKVEVEDLDPGRYDLRVGDTVEGTIKVGTTDDGTEGEIEFRDPAETGHPQLTFDPRGQHVSVEQNGTVYLEADIPTDA